MFASKALRVLVPGLLLPTLMAHAGGWAVITVDELPDSIQAGKPVELSFMVRQHGFTLLDSLRPSISASYGRLDATGTVRPTDQRGRYRASFTIPSPGEWSITIRSGFGNSNVTLLPIPVIAHGESLTRPASDTDRGRRLFVAKGCVTCHEQIEVGPRLAGKRFDATYIARFLASPPSTPSQPGRSTMPNLALETREIAVLVSYLNSDRQVTVKP
jgi:hypothetical protein